MKEKLEIILKAIGEKKGEDILVFAFSSLNPAVDEVVIASASNQRQVFALADNVKVRQRGFPHIINRNPVYHPFKNEIIFFQGSASFSKCF